MKIDISILNEDASIDLTGLYYILLDGKILNLSNMQIEDPLYDEVHFIYKDLHETNSVYRSYSNYIADRNGRYEYLDLKNDICNGSALIEHGFLAYFTNDFIFDLYMQYYEKYLANKKFCDVSTYCNHIAQVIGGISLYDINDL